MAVRLKNKPMPFTQNGPTLRMAWLVAKASADEHLIQCTEAALAIQANSVVIVLKEAREALKHQQAEQMWRTQTVTLGRELVISHMMILWLKADAKRINLRWAVLKNIQWAAIAMNSAVACCVVLQNHFPQEQLFIDSLNTAYGWNPKKNYNFNRSQLLKAYHHIFGGTATEAFKSKASKDTERRGHARPPRLTTAVADDVDPNAAVAASIWWAEEMGGDLSVPHCLSEALRLEPSVLPMSNVAEFMSGGQPMPNVAGLVSTWVPTPLTPTQWLCDAAARQRDAGEQLAASAQFEPLIAIQKERRCRTGIGTVYEKGVCRLIGQDQSCSSLASSLSRSLWLI